MSDASWALVWAWQQWRRDGRTAGLRLMAASVLLGVTVFAATTFFVDRMGRAVQAHAAQWLGGDVVVVSDRPLPSTFEQEARRRGLSVARTAAFASMARAPQAAGAATRLVVVKAVSDAYPLRGQLVLGERVPSDHALASGRPAPGQAWAEASVLHALHLRLGDDVLLGDGRLRLTAMLISEPDRGSAMANIAPRLMMNEADLPSTHLIQPASRVTWRLLVAALDPALPANLPDRYEAWAQGIIQGQGLRGVHIETLANGRPEMQQTLERAMNFVRLVGLLTGIYAAVAMALAARDFALSRIDACALQRVLGASQRLILSTYVFSLGLTCLLASALGVGLAWCVQAGLGELATKVLHMALPPADARVGWVGLGVGACVGLGFGLPAVVQLARVPALRVMRRELGQPQPLSVLGALLALGGAIVLTAMAAANLRLAVYTLGGFALAGFMFALVAYACLRALRRWSSTHAAQGWPPAWRLGLRQLGAHSALLTLQTTALGLSLLALVLLGIVRAGVLQDWQSGAAPDADNRFIINIVPDQAADVRRYLHEHGVSGYDWYPMLRARLIEINHRAVHSSDYAQERAQRLLDREFNLSYAPELPQHNELVQGQWRSGDSDAWSVEEGLAQTLRLKLGDELAFDLQGHVVRGHIGSLRKVDWGSMRVNFFVMRPTLSLDDPSVTYIAALRAPGDPQFDDGLSQNFPNLTVVDVSMALAQVQDMLRQLSQAVEFLFLFTLGAGLLVVLNALWLTREQRVREVAVMRALGADNRLLHALQRNELLLLGGLAGALSGGAAQALDWALATQVFHLDWQARWGWWPLSVVLGAGLAWMIGRIGLRGVLKRPVNETLRQAL